MQTLEYDRRFNVWVDPKGQIDYSDGAQNEARVLKAILESKDCSIFSEDLHRQICDWPSEYHFAWERSNILRPVLIERGARVLEIGAGFGAITRYLGEIGAEVLAVEGGLPRARGAGARCRDLSNVKVCAANFNRLDLGPDPFDVVTLIGVFEYTAKYSTEAQPFRRMLERCRALVGDRGRLVIAIENRLGFKYLVGYEEDHLGTVHSGVSDLYDSRGVRTFGRRELSRMLNDAGFASVDFLYPFPDYKLPRIVVADEGLAMPGFEPADLLLGSQSRNYSGKPAPEVSEALCFRNLHRNGVMGDLANSFLVVASAASWGPQARMAPLAWTFSSDRKAQFAVETLFVRNPSGSGIEVTKKRMQPMVSGATPGGISHELPAHSAYIVGENLGGILERLLARKDMGGFVAALCEWAASVKAMEDRAGGRGAPGTGLLFDALPRNWIRDADGVLRPIDLEWRSSTPLSARSVVIRYGLVDHAALTKMADSHMDVRGLIDRVLAAISEPASTEEEWDAMIQANNSIGKEVMLPELRTWRSRSVRQAATEEQIAASGEFLLPWQSDVLIDFGEVKVEVSPQPAEHGSTAVDNHFLVGGSRRIIDAFYSEIGGRKPRHIVRIGSLGGDVVLLNEAVKPEKIVNMEGGRTSFPALLRYIQAQPQNRVRAYAGISQGDKLALQKIYLKEFYAGLDLVIDNGSHLYGDTRAAFHGLFPKLKSGGLYVIESWAWAHWPGDFWQKERGGEGFRKQPPASNFLVELMLASASASGIVHQVRFDSHAIYVERGSDTVAQDFDLGNYCLNRGDPIARFRVPK